jgi:hypothetical protein
MRTLKKRCEATKCKKWVSVTMKLYDSDIKKNRKTLFDRIKIKEKMINDKSSSVEEKKEAKILLNKLKKMLKSSLFQKTKKNRKRFANRTNKSCKQLFCNPGCKNTAFESGNKLPKTVILSSKKISSSWLEYKQKKRKEIFGNKTNVLVDDFYEKLNHNVVAKYKKDGAISGCFEPDFH